MPFDPMRSAAGTLTPDEFNLVFDVFTRINAEPWVTKSNEGQRQLARYVLHMYERGLCDEERLYRLCLSAARVKFAQEPVTMPGAAECRD